MLCFYSTWTPLFIFHYASLHYNNTRHSFLKSREKSVAKVHGDSPLPKRLYVLDELLFCAWLSLLANKVFHGMPKYMFDGFVSLYCKLY